MTDSELIEKPNVIKAWISNLVRTTDFWKNHHHVPKYLKVK